MTTLSVFLVWHGIILANVAAWHGARWLHRRMLDRVVADVDATFAPAPLPIDDQCPLDVLPVLVERGERIVLPVVIDGALVAVLHHDPVTGDCREREIVGGG